VGRAGKLPVPELLRVLGEAAARGGCLTDEQIEALHAARLKSLSDTLAGQYLSDQQRTKIIDQSLRLRSDPEPEEIPEAEVVP
jgi:hypothetical protein